MWTKDIFDVDTHGHHGFEVVVDIHLMKNHSRYEISAAKHYEPLCYWTRLLCR